MPGFLRRVRMVMTYTGVLRMNSNGCSRNLTSAAVQGRPRPRVTFSWEVTLKALDDTLIPLKLAAKHCGMTYPELYRRIGQGHLQVKRIGPHLFVPKRELDSFLLKLDSKPDAAA